MRKIGNCMLGERDHLCRHITGKEKKRKAQKHLEWKHNSTDRVLKPDQLMRQLKERLSGEILSTVRPNQASGRGQLQTNKRHSLKLSIRGTSHGRVSVRLSVTSRCSIETAERSELGLAHELPSTRPTLC